MPASTTETVRMLSVTVLEELDDPELQYRLWTALQLLSVVEEQSGVTKDVIANTDLDSGIRDRLRQLGYRD